MLLLLYQSGFIRETKDGNVFLMTCSQTSWDNSSIHFSPSLSPVTYTNPRWLSIRCKGVLCSQTVWSSPSMSHVQNLPSCRVGVWCGHGKTNRSLAKSLEWTSQSYALTCGLLHCLHVMADMTRKNCCLILSRHSDVVAIRPLFWLVVVSI